MTEDTIKPTVKMITNENGTEWANDWDHLNFVEVDRRKGVLTVDISTTKIEIRNESNNRAWYGYDGQAATSILGQNGWVDLELKLDGGDTKDLKLWPHETATSGSPFVTLKLTKKTGG